MRCALLSLTGQDRAIFSERAATEGTHVTRLAPTGSALLGWAASQGRYDKFGAKAFEIFHSGRIRFSDALPVLGADELAFPLPQLLLQRKHIGGGIRGEGLVASEVWVGRGAFESDPENMAQRLQGEALKPRFLTVSGIVSTPRTGGRLRTATLEGKAQRGALFGFTHLEPVDAPRYLATIEAEGGVINDNEWSLLLGAFQGKELRLGRARSTGYGGWYKCKVRDGEGVDLWPKGAIAEGDKRVRVWALSDLALLDERGSPCLAPTAAMLRLPPAFVLDLQNSAIATRRYVPWNAHLDCRDVERHVVGAGSVLTFVIRKGALANAKEGPGAVGLWQECGLGRIWVNPELLRGDHPELKESRATLIAPAMPAPDAPSESKLTRWATAQAQLANTLERDRLCRKWSKDLRAARAVSVGPSPSQWAAVAQAARHRRKVEAIVRAGLAACGSGDSATRKNDWDAEFGPGTTYRQWLERCLDEGRALTAQHLQWALDHLAKEAARLIRAEREGSDRPARANG